MSLATANPPRVLSPLRVLLLLLLLLQLLADLRAGTVRVETKAGPVVLPERPAFWAGFIVIGEPE